MGSVHEFKPRPKNERQFKGYQPKPPLAAGSRKRARWQLQDWQKSLLAWSALVLLAAAFWGMARIL